ncbi:MAG: hypothetical protein RLZZ70_257 [Candidatus Parcubacteria bacterium]|jgi:hypothetical protein
MTPIPLDAAVDQSNAVLPKFGTLFKNSWRWVFADPQRLLLLAGLLLLTMVVSIGVEFLNPPAGTAIGGVADFMPVMIGSVLSMILSMVVYTYLATRIALPVNFVPTDAVAMTKRYFVPFVIVTLAMSFMIVLGFLALIIPGVLLMVYLSIVPWVVIAEGLQGKAALLRSVDIVRNRFWYVTLQFFLLGLVFLPIFLLALGIVLASTWYFLMGGAASWWLIPVYVALFFVVYALPMLIALRFSYELYRGLVATYVPVANSWWWQGGLFTVLYVLSLIVAGVVLIGSVANYYFVGQEVPEEDFMFDAAQLEALETTYDIQ